MRLKNLRLLVKMLLGLLLMLKSNQVLLTKAKGGKVVLLTNTLQVHLLKNYC
jgi:hypothetical protein